MHPALESLSTPTNPFVPPLTLQGLDAMDRNVDSASQMPKNLSQTRSGLLVPHFAFLALPAEIRQMVYGFHFPTSAFYGPLSAPWDNSTTRVYANTGELNMMYVCRLLFDETQRAMREWRKHIHTLIPRSELERHGVFFGDGNCAVRDLVFPSY